MPNYKVKVETEFYVVVTASDENEAFNHVDSIYSNIGGDPSVQIWGEIPDSKLDQERKLSDGYFNLENNQ